MHKTDQAYFSFALRIIGKFGIIIVLPVITLVFLGIRLDVIYKSNPLFKIGGLLLAALISGHLIYRQSKKYGLEFQKISQKNNSV